MAQQRARFLTVAEVADIMRVSSMTVYRLIKAGDLRAVKVGRSYRLPEDEVDRYLEHMETESCASCHSLTDPIGFGLENYDIAGRYRAHDDLDPQCAIEGQGNIVGLGDFKGPKALADLLLGSEAFVPCVVEHWLSFGLGRALTREDAGLLQTMVEAFAAENYDFRALVRALVASDSFVRPGVQSEGRIR